LVENTIGIILARGGSKGIPLKNIAPFLGAPLISWSISQLLAAGVSRVVVSTDHDQIAEVAKEWGAEVLIRPPHLSTDTALGDLALVHAVESLSLPPQAIAVLAQATSPLRHPQHFSEALDVFVREGYDSLFSAVEIPDLCVWRSTPQMSSITYDYRQRSNRQELGGLLVENGSFYLTRVDTLLSSKNRLGGKIGRYSMPSWTLHEIDDPTDLELCSAIMSRYGIPITLPQTINQQTSRH
jgi:CMP-N,N'-diacetyllegionaminic acid synthase